MSAATAARKITSMGVDPEVFPFTLDAPLKANAKLVVGALAASDSSGYYVDPTATTGLFLAGVVLSKAGYPQFYDNTGGANGAIVARIQERPISFFSGTAGDALTQANLWQPVWCIDDQTVGLTDGGATPRSLAGILCGFDGSGNPIVFVSGILNAAILASRRAGLAALTSETLSAAGAISPTIDTTFLQITGTMAFTLADGTKVGQVKLINVSSAASTPAGTVTPAHALGFTSISALNAIGMTIELRWNGTAWYLISSRGGTIA